MTTHAENNFPIAQLDMQLRAGHRHLSKDNLLPKLQTIVATADDDARKRRENLMTCYKDYLETALSSIQTSFERGENDGSYTVSAIAYVMDVLLQSIYTIETNIHMNDSPKGIAILATGGYGRGELAPCSDVDILFLTVAEPDTHMERVINDFMYILWDLGIKVGHSVRSVSDALGFARDDIVFRTSLIDTRFVTGDKGLYVSLMDDFGVAVDKWSDKDFFDAKLAEWDARHDKIGNTRYVLEPNIKEGKGSLRDLHTLYWLSRYVLKLEVIEQLIDEGIFTKDEIARLARAQEFLWKMRCHMHYVTNRPSEILNFDLQSQVAEKMYADVMDTSKPNRHVEKMMHDYFLVVRDIGLLMGIFLSSMHSIVKTRRFSLTLTKGKKYCDGFPIMQEKVSLEESQILETPKSMMGVFRAAVENNMGIHPKTLILINRHLHKMDDALRYNDAVVDDFFAILCCQKNNPVVMLGRMNECGLLSAFMPDFAGIVAQMQYNMYHSYTTDEHSIRAIGNLWRLEHGQLNDDFPVVSQVIKGIKQRRVLYMAVLIHDIAKGRGGDHSELGAKVAGDICPKLGFDKNQTELIVWLIANHLFMSDLALRRDVGDAKTIDEFVDRVQSRERMDLLYCLTAVDIYSVGDNVWNSWKSKLLRTLYYISEGVVIGNVSNREMLENMARQNTDAIYQLSTAPDAVVEKFLDMLPDNYLVTSRPEDLVSQIDMVVHSDSSDEKIHTRWAENADNDVAVLTIYIQDFVGLCAKISGALNSCNVLVVDARFINLKNDMCLCQIHLHDINGVMFNYQQDGKRVLDTIIKALSGEIWLQGSVSKNSLPSLKKIENFTVQPAVVFYDNASDSHTVVECRGRDRKGLLYDLANVFLDCHIQTDDIRINTYGERVVDVFYVRTLTGRKFYDERKRDKLREKLLEVLA